MKYYGELCKLGVFSREDVIKLIGNSNTASSLINAYLKKGYIERVRKNLYTAIDLSTGFSVLNDFQLASHLFDDAFLGGHTAFEYYGMANQVFFWMYIYTNTRFKDFEYRNAAYHRFAPKKDMDIIERNDVRLTSLEETLLDCIDDEGIVGGMDELLHCIMMISYLDEKKLVQILQRENNLFLYQKTGYLLEIFQKDLRLSDNFFVYCQKHLPTGKRYLMTNTPLKIHLNKRWNFYTPVRLSTLVNNGDYIDYDF